MEAPKRSLKLADISIDDHELIDSLTDDEFRSLLLELYNDDPEPLMKHAAIGVKIMYGSHAAAPAPFWWLDVPEGKKDWVQ